MPGTTSTYPEARWPRRWRIFGRTLHPYCIGHELLLQRYCDRFFDGSSVTIGDVCIAIRICSRSPAAAERIMTDGPGLLTALFELLLRFYAHRSAAGFLLRHAMLSAYIRESFSSPRYWSGGGQIGRSPGTPPGLRLLQTLMAIGYDEPVAISMPMQRVIWEVAAAREKAGGIELVNEDEAEAIGC